MARLAAACLPIALLLATATAALARDATTTLFSRSLAGGTPNGASTNAVISTDLRYSQVIAFESEASDLVNGDTNQMKDVFAVRRAGSFGNTGSEWMPGATQLVSRGLDGKPANGPSSDPAVDGDNRNRARCVAFLSDASNLVSGDTNGVADAFVAKAPRFKPKRVSLPKNKQSSARTTQVAISGDCSLAAFVIGGKLYVRAGKSTVALVKKGAPRDPSFATGDTNALVFGAAGGIYMSSDGTSTPTRIVKGGRNPALNFTNRRKALAYEVDRGGHSQIAYRDLGEAETIITSFGSEMGDGDSRDPMVVNTGFYVGFESDAANLATKASGTQGDANGVTDAYLFTDARSTTLLESVDSSSDPLATGARRPSTSYYRNYVVFDSSLNDSSAPPQIYLRYLGGI
jgi:TolB protein